MSLLRLHALRRRPARRSPTPRLIPLAQLRYRVLNELGDEWVTPSEIVDRLQVGHGEEWYRVCLVLERLANDGLLDIRIRGNRQKFRRGWR